MNKIFSKDRLKAVASLITTLIGGGTAVLSYAQLPPKVAGAVAAAVGVLTSIAGYIAVYQTTNVASTPAVDPSTVGTFNVSTTEGMQTVTPANSPNITTTNVPPTP